MGSSILERRFAWRVGAVAISLAIAAVATSSAFRGGRGGSPRFTLGAAASCAALSPAQQFKSARVVVDGTMLPGPTVLSGSRRVLVSPARMRVSRYLKGHGPRIVKVATAITPARNGTVVSEDGIDPVPGQRWRIYSGSSRQPLATSICAGSRRLGHPATPPHPRRPRATLESVPWHLLRVSGRRVTVGWSSGTCGPTLKPDPTIKAVETSSAVTLIVLVHVVKAGGFPCAGVGLGGTLSTTLAAPLGHRSLIHGVVTDRAA